MLYQFQSGPSQTLLFHHAEHGVVAFEEILVRLFRSDVFVDYVLGVGVVNLQFDSLVPLPAV